MQVRCSAYPSNFEHRIREKGYKKDDRLQEKRVRKQMMFFVLLLLPSFVFVVHFALEHGSFGIPENKKLTKDSKNIYLL